jgi:hypothetical protein
VNSIDRLESVIKTELTRLDKEMKEISGEAAKADLQGFDDLRDGLNQRASDLMQEWGELYKVWNQLPYLKARIHRKKMRSVKL